MSAIVDAPKVTFQLTAHTERLEVRALAPGGEGKAEMALPPRDLLDRLRESNSTPIPSSALKLIGKTLYQCLPWLLLGGGVVALLIIGGLLLWLTAN